MSKNRQDIADILLQSRGMRRPLASSKSPVSVEVFNSFEAISREEWDAFVLSVEGDIYVTHDWCRIWWKHYENRDLRIFLFRAAGNLVGIVPVFIERLRLRNSSASSWRNGSVLTSR